MNLSRRVDKNGVIIISCFWILLIMSALALSIAYRASIGLKLVQYYKDDLRASRETSLAIKNFIKDRVKKEPIYEVIDEQGKLNLNSLFVNKAILLNLPSMNRDFTAALFKYKDCKSGLKLNNLEELTLIDDFDPKILKELENYVTVYGNGLVNINTAEKEVLKALSLKDALIDKIIKYRSNALFNSNDLNSLFESKLMLDSEEKTSLSRIRNTLTASSNCFRLNILVSIGKVNKKTNVVVERLLGDKYKIRYWHES